MLPLRRKHFRRLARDWRTYGPRYAALEALEFVSSRVLVEPAQKRILKIEGERGILGPALTRYAGHSVGENRDAWSRYDWREDGDDWTWSQEWKNAMIDHLLRPTMSPGGVIIEIGPGGGRWTGYLADLAQELILVDVTDRTLELCRQRLGDRGHPRFIRNNGSDFPDVADHSVDRIWSFDVFGHIAPLDTASYLAEMARVLRPGGVAVIHHPGAWHPLYHDGWRSPMTARLFANLAQDRGIKIQRQLDQWPGSGQPLAYGDVITVMYRD